MKMSVVLCTPFTFDLLVYYLQLKTTTLPIQYFISMLLESRPKALSSRSPDLPFSLTTRRRHRPYSHNPGCHHWTTISPPFHPSFPASSTQLHQLPPHLIYVTAPPAVSAAAVSFLKLAMAFIAGGIFFSTVTAAVTACYAMGMDNVKTLLDLVSIVFGKVWDTFTLGLSLTKKALLLEDEEVVVVGKKKKWNYKRAWETFKEQWLVTKRTAVEGVQAIREEAKLYSAAVGMPGLIPLQHLVDRFMPMISTILQDSVKDALTNMKKSKAFRKIALSGFTAGKKSPVLKAARVYDVENAVAFDYDVEWNSEMEATMHVYATPLLGLARIPIKVKNLQFEGTVRLILTPLMDQPPGYGAMLLSFPKTPKMNLDLQILGGELTKFPFLRREIIGAVQKGISEELLWPRRSVIPTTLENKKLVLNARALKQLETSDPLLLAEERLAASQPMLRKVHANKQPNTIKEKQEMFRLSFFGNKKKRGTSKNGDSSTEEDEDEGEEEVTNESSTLEMQLDKNHLHLDKAQKGLFWSSLEHHFHEGEKNGEESLLSRMAHKVRHQVQLDLKNLSTKPGVHKYKLLSHVTRDSKDDHMLDAMANEHYLHEPNDTVK